MKSSDLLNCTCVLLKSTLEVFALLNPLIVSHALKTAAALIWLLKADLIQCEVAVLRLLRLSAKGETQLPSGKVTVSGQSF